MDLFVYRNIFSLMQYLSVHKQITHSNNTVVVRDITYADHEEDLNIIRKCCDSGIFIAHINLTDLNGKHFDNMYVSSSVTDTLLKHLFTSEFDNVYLLQEGISLFDMTTKYTVLNRVLFEKSSKQFVTVDSLLTNNGVSKQKINMDADSMKIILDSVEKVKDLKVDKILFTSPFSENFDLDSEDIISRITKTLPKSTWIKKHPRDPIDWQKLGYRELPQIICSEVCVMLFLNAEKIFMYPSSTQLIKEDNRTVNLKFSVSNIEYNEQFNNCIELLGIKDSHIKII